ncbi:MAG: ABC transporter permease [Acidobacteria bacterium]|nr:MAG: ABC transporter permease [Acidobacteriota bacterium]
MLSESVVVNGKTAAQLPLVVIEPSQGWIRINLAELFQYRELVFFLAWRDVKVRYKQTVLGAMWAILQPIITMVIFSVFLGRLAKVPSDGVPYPIFAYTALVPWALFATGLTQASNSLVNGANLLRKVYFPRLVMPIASVLVGVVDFLLAFTVLLAMMLLYGFAPTSAVVVIPGLFLLTIMTSLGAGLWLAAFNVRFRDVRYIIPFLVEIWLLATPIAYPSSLLSESWRQVYAINPMVGVVEGFRWALLGTDTAPGPMVLVSSIASALLLVSGVFVFRRMERNLADVV